MTGELSVFHARNRLPVGERLWAYALGAVYHVAHGYAVDGIDPIKRGDFQGEMLSRDWGVNNRDELVTQLNHLGMEGHRFGHVTKLRYYAMQWRPAIAAMREELRASIRDGDEEAEESAANLWRLDAVQADERGIRSSPLLAFDAARAVMLTRAGTMLGWLREEEAWAFLNALARDVQRHYGSWADYGADFLLSRDVWRGGAELDSFDTTVRMLLRDKASPWTTLPWDLPLATDAPDPETASGPVWTLEKR